MSASSATVPAPAAGRKLALGHEGILLLLVVAEVALFHFTARRFLAPDNLTNILRHSTEIGLLSLAMLPIVLTGGIDLSVGSLMGLCAVAFGYLVEICSLSPWAAGALTILLGACAGGLNAFLISEIRLPPLIVTLGSYSLFRGIAEAATKGTITYSRFPPGVLQLGNGALLGLPIQGWILIAAAILFYLMVHWTVLGRSWRALGYSPAGALYAGLPVKQRLTLPYILSGAVAALAAVIYTARVTQARADAGTGYELAAITAVVLGGASIFGGSGSIPGTILGVAAIGVLSNGLGRIPEIMSVSRELAGISTGLLLLVALSAAAAARLLHERRSRITRRA